MQAAELSTATAVAGARNLLRDCAGVRAGDSVLLIVEPPGQGYYDDRMGPFLAEETRRLGGRPILFEAAVSCEPDHPPAALIAAIAEAGHTIFLNRIGDQLRFQPLPGAGGKAMSYALDFDLLGSPFGTVPYGLFAAVGERLAARLAEARSYRIECPLGTDLSMTLTERRPAAVDFTVKTFPFMILPPFPATGASGRLVLSQALTSTYIHAYDDSIVPLAEPIALTLEAGEIVAVEGEAGLVARVKDQFERVARLFGEPAWRVNSWHIGANPTTFFPRPALSDMDRWAGVVFGSPRYLHLHMCGPAPGDVCGQVFDPVVSFDGEPLWRGGRLTFADRPDIRALAERFGAGPGVFDTRRDIGLEGEAA